MVNVLDFPQELFDLDSQSYEYPTLATMEAPGSIDEIELLARINDVLWDGVY